ncbi:MAG: hypothetical protein E7H54_05900 [Clostridium perfringens]|nr:hypothetical protein [Clostridium perfringens]
MDKKWYEDVKVTEESVRLLLDKFFVADLLRTRERVNYIHSLLDDNKKQDACNEMFFLLQERVKNLYERHVQLKLAISDEEELKVKFNEDNRQITNYLKNSDKEGCRHFSDWFLYDTDLKEFDGEDLPRYSFMRYVTDEDREVLFFANCFQHANLSLSKMLQSEGELFLRMFDRMEDILEQTERALNSIIKKLNNTIGDIKDDDDYRVIWNKYFQRRAE